MTDQEAIEALKRGDPAGMDSLVHAHQQRALRIAYQITRNSESAEDVVADAFLTVFRRISGQDSMRPFEPWFLRVVINRAISVTRRERRFQKIVRFLRPPLVSEAPDAIAERNEEFRAITDAVTRLPAKERAVVVLRHSLDLDERSIADMLGWPLGSVKTRLRRAHGRIREQLASSTVDASAVTVARCEGETQ
jgi:RNA polymerase sigma-70 factor (ECF subfamily)